MTGKMGMHPILAITLSVKKIKGAAHRRYGDGVIWCEQTFRLRLSVILWSQVMSGLISNLKSVSVSMCRLA